MGHIKRYLKRTDAFRRKFTKGLVNFLFVFKKRKNTTSIDVQEIKRVLICRPNHRLGNQILITPIVQEVETIFPNAKIDLFLKGNLGKIIFKNYSSVDRLILLPKDHFKNPFQYIRSWLSIKKKKYDLVINANDGSSSGRLATAFSNSKYRLLSGSDALIESAPKDYEHFAKRPVYQLRHFLAEAGTQIKERIIPVLDLKLSESEKENGKNILYQLTQNHKPTIGVYTYATADKCYAPEDWLPFYEKLKDKYGENFNIVEVLPIENVSQINFSATHFYGKDLRELASMMSAMTIFISGDCGMMHLASTAQIPVIGLFKFDNIKKYQPYGNGSIGISTQDLNEERIFRAIIPLIL